MLISSPPTPDATGSIKGKLKLTGDLGGIASSPTVIFSNDTIHLVRANNLSDLTSVSTAQSNLGLVIGTNVQAFDADLSAIAALSSTGIAVRTGTNTWVQRTITGTSNRISLSNGNGVSGNPTIDIDSAYVGQSSITTLGTIATGTWSATTVAVNKGGTGQTSYTNGQLLIGNTTGNTLTKATLTGTANQVVVTNSTGSITLSTPQDIATSSSPTFSQLGINVSPSLAQIRTDSTASASIGQGIYASITTSNASFDATGLTFVANSTISTGTLAQLAGMQGNVYPQGSGGSISNVYGGRPNIWLFGAEAIGDVVGFGPWIRTIDGSTNGITNATGFKTQWNIAATGAPMTNVYGFWHQAPSIAGGGPAPTNQYGFYSDDITGATNNYVFYSNETAGTNNYAMYHAGTAKSYFAGSIGIGQTSPTALLHIKAGTASANTAPLKLTSGTNLTTPEVGAIEYDANNLYITKNTAIRESIPGVLFTQTADQTVTNTVTETTILGTGVGTKTLPANFFVAGKTIRLRVGGIYSTPALAAPSVTIKVKYGSTVIATVTTSALLSGATNLEFDGEVLITCRTTGSSGTVMVHGDIEYATGVAGTIAVDPLNNAGATTTINTTTSNALDVTIIWDTATSTRSAKSIISEIEVLN